MKTALIIASALALALVACEETKPTPADTKAAATADLAKDKAQVAKNEADKAAEAAKKKADEAEAKLKAAKDTAEDATDKLGSDWKGPDKSGWGRSWTGFYGGTDKTVDSGDWTIERGAGGMYTAWRKVKAAVADAGAKIDDASVTTAVKAKLATDDTIKARNIDVDTKANVVHLKGAADSADQAGEAMRIALGTIGVEKVVSHLTWKAAADAGAAPATSAAPAKK
ncbi:MAG: BON domain-containing protein [Polyangiaceae bacterium]